MIKTSNYKSSILLFVILVIGLSGCGKGTSDGNLIGALTSGGAIDPSLFDKVPGTFELSRPANGAKDVSLTPVFEWTDASGEGLYTIEILDSETYNTQGGILKPLQFTSTRYMRNDIAANTISFSLPACRNSNEWNNICVASICNQRCWTNGGE